MDLFFDQVLNGVGTGVIYASVALALVIIESVTGEVPFVADTTLGTLMARVDRPLAVPDIE